VEFEVRYQTAQEICASVGPIVIRICDGSDTEFEDLIRVDQLFRELLEVHANIGMLLVFTHGTPMPNANAQAHAREVMRELGDRLVIAIALLGLGFWSSAVRTTLSTLVRAVGHGGISIEGSVELAVARLTTELIGIDGDELLRAYGLLWAQLTEPSPPPLAG
jgi:hypothetical protein